MAWIRRHKCAVIKFGLALLFAALFIALFASGASSLVPVLLVKLGMAGTVSAVTGTVTAAAGTVLAAKFLMMLAGLGVSVSVIGDFIVCKFLNVPECCQPAVAFWRRYGDFVQANGGAAGLTAAQCAELKKMLDDMSGVEKSDMDAIRRFLQEHCPQEEGEGH